MELKIDWVALRTALQTAGSLMVGNVGVAANLLGNRNWPALGTLLVVGSGVISSTAQIARLEQGVASENGSQSTLAAGGRKSSGSHGGSRPLAGVRDWRLCRCSALGG